MKKQPIHSTDWDYLIILDACRYDYFKELYKNYENLKQSNLEKRKSRGSNTAEWLEKTFTKQYNYTYISANPFINSQGLSLSKIVNDYNSNWKAKNHFKEIINLWATKWNKEKETVMPKSVSKATKKINRGNKIISHYIQPHIPYITYPESQGLALNRNTSKNPNIVKKITKYFWDKLDEKQKWKMRDKLGMGNNVFGKLYTGKITRKEITKYYKENLEIALKSVNNLIKKLEGKIIITADHGEAFGEQGEYCHPSGSSNPVLRRVPWLEIDKEQKEKNKIKEKIKGIK